MEHTAAMALYVARRALPQGSLLLHVGAHKTGTTSLQAALYEAREGLMRHGVFNLVPQGHETANVAARAAQRLPASGTSGPSVDYAIWTELVQASAAHAKERVVISAEAFATSEPAVIKKIVRDLGVERLQVVVTLRALAKILPSQWQQDLHGAWESRAFDSWLESVLADPRPSRRVGPLELPNPFWYRHRHDALVKRWADAVGSDRVTIIVVDDQRPVALFETMEGLLGLQPGALPRTTAQRNRSMTLPEMLIMQRYGELLESTELGRRVVERQRYHRALRILRKIRPDNSMDARLEIPLWSLERVHEIQEEIVVGLMAVDTRVIGSLEDLKRRPVPGSRASSAGAATGDLPSGERDLIAERMLKSAARRVGLDSRATGDHRRDPAIGPVRLFFSARCSAARAFRLAARYLRIRY